MASKRRSGFRTPELRGTLGTLLRTTTGVVRDALERGAREGRARLDDVRASRRRSDALAELGELVLELIRRGEIDIDELPEARDVVQQLDEIDAADGDAVPRPTPRNRFDDRDDDRPRAEARPRSPGSLGPWTRPAARDGRGTSRGAEERPLGHRHDRADDDEHIGHRDDEETLDGFHRRSARDTDTDGTVSSGAVPRRSSPGRDSGATAIPADAASRATRPTTPARPLAEPPSARAPTKPIKSLPRRADSESGATRRADSESGATAVPTTAESSSSRSRFPPTPHRKGGISFDEDDADLADYMHPDDVPAKTTPKDGDNDA